MKAICRVAALNFLGAIWEGKMNYAAAPKRPDDPTKFHRLDRVNNHFIYDGRQIERPTSSEGLDRDALLIRQYMDKFQEFGEEAEELQRHYFGLMGWLYFAPFMPGLARAIHCTGGNAARDIKHLAIIYGQSNCGKSALVKFLMTSMFGPPAVLSDSLFTQTEFTQRQPHVGVLPLYYEDVGGNRFSGGSRNQGELIIKLYDSLVGKTAHYPCTLVTVNAEASEFANEVRNRGFPIYARIGIASDDDDTRRRLDKEVLPLQNRIGQDFYAEYLYRMGEIVAGIQDSGQDPSLFDYLFESTTLIRMLMLEHLRADEVIPAWAKPITTSDFTRWAWGLKHRQLANRLARHLYRPHNPPPVGYWTATATDILIGVDSVRDIMRAREIQDHWVNREHTHGSSKVLYLHRGAVVESVQRTIPAWRLPVPSLQRFTEFFQRRR